MSHVSKVFKLEEVIRNVKDSVAYGHKIRCTPCYKDDQLGVCIRWATGEVELADTFETVNSMYGSGNLSEDD